MKSNDPGGLSENSEIYTQNNSFELGTTYNSCVKNSGMNRSLSLIISIILPLTCLAQYEKETSLDSTIHLLSLRRYIFKPTVITMHREKTSGSKRTSSKILIFIFHITV